MHTIDIMRGSDVFFTIKPDESSVQVKRIMAENEIRLQFAVNHQCAFLIGDYCTVYGEVYKLNKPATEEKITVNEYRYNMTMEGYQYDLTKVMYLFYGDDNSIKEGDFALMGNAETFIDLLLKNLQRIDNSWTKGQVLPSDYKNLTFSNDSCYSALGKISEAFETEFWIEGKTIHLTKRSYITGWLLRQGRNHGLYTITRKPVDNTSIVTRLYAFGSDKNIPSDYRNYSNRLKLPEPDIYLEKNIDKYGVIERTEIFADIFPNRTGTVTAVDAGNPYKFKDVAIDFDVNAQLLPGITAKITFNSGQLSGYTFEISNFDDPTSEFTIVRSKNETSIEVPSDLIRPGIGDQYVLTDIKMPDSYIIAAELALKDRAQAFLDLYAALNYVYTISFDPTYLTRKRIVPAIGQIIVLNDSELEVNKPIRIISTTRQLINEMMIDVDMADIIGTNTIALLQKGLGNTSTTVSNLQDDYNTNALIRNNKVLGDLKIEQGTIIAKDMKEAPGGTLKDLVIDIATGTIYWQ